jgi:hypothetical protein
MGARGEREREREREKERNMNQPKRRWQFKYTDYEKLSSRCSLFQMPYLGTLCACLQNTDFSWMQLNVRYCTDVRFLQQKSPHIYDNQRTKQKSSIFNPDEEKQFPSPCSLQSLMCEYLVDYFQTFRVSSPALSGKE